MPQLFFQCMRIAPFFELQLEPLVAQQSLLIIAFASLLRPTSRTLSCVMSLRFCLHVIS